MLSINETLLNNIIEEMEKNNQITEIYLASKYFYSERTIRRYINILKKKKKIILIGTGKKRCWKVYK